MRRQNFSGIVLLVIGTVSGFSGCSENPADVPPQPVRGAPVDLGQGAVSTYADFDSSGAPVAVS